MDKKITPGGLKEIEIKALEAINLENLKNNKLSGYALAKLLKIDKKKAYLIADKLRRFGYLTNSNSRNLEISDFGKGLYNWVVSKSDNIIYK